MITEHPVIEHLVVEYATAADVFRLDLSPLDGTDLLAGDVADAFTWTPILANATDVELERGISRDGITLRTEAGRARISLSNDLDPTTNPEVRPNVPLRIRHVGGGLIFTGLLEDVLLSYDKRGNTFTQIVAVDAVRDVANTPRYGAVNPGAEHELITDRFRRLLTSSPVPWRVDGLPGPIRPDVSNYGFGSVAEADDLLDALDYPGRWEIFGSDIFGMPPHFQTAQTNAFGRVTGLTPGRRYTVVVRMLGWGIEPGATGESDGLRVHLQPGPTPAGDDLASVRVEDGPGDPRRVELTFTATTTEAYVRAYCDFPDYEGIGLHTRPVFVVGFQLVEHTPTYAPNIVHESDLASHLDIAATTARTAWYVDTAGTLRVAARYPLGGEDTPVTHFADDGTGEHSYVGAAAGFDTADLVSSVELENHARAFDAEAGEWYADDHKLGPWEDHTAAATYGQRRGRLETTIVDVDEPGAISPADLATLTLADHSTVRLSVHELRWNAAEDYALAPDLEVWSVVTVTHRGATRRMRILKVRHEIAPKRWIVTLTFKEA